MKMIAVTTVQGRKTLKAANPNNPKDRGRYETLIAKPQVEFDTADFGIGDEEAADLIASGVAKRKVREVPDDGAGFSPAGGSGPGGG